MASPRTRVTRAVLLALLALLVCMAVSCAVWGLQRLLTSRRDGVAAAIETFDSGTVNDGVSDDDSGMVFSAFVEVMTRAPSAREARDYGIAVARGNMDRSTLVGLLRSTREYASTLPAVVDPSNVHGGWSPDTLRQMEDAEADSFLRSAPGLCATRSPSVMMDGSAVHRALFSRRRTDATTYPKVEPPSLEVALSTAQSARDRDLQRIQCLRMCRSNGTCDA